jgi:hypothetical protein
MTKFNINKIDMIAHSFGTIIVSGLLNIDTNNKIGKVVMIEPACFFQRFQSIYRFVNNPPTNTFLSNFVGYTVYADMYVKYIIDRYLHGPDFWIYDYNDIKSDRFLFILSENDEIVTTKVLLKNMVNYNINHIVIENCSHAELFLSSKHSDKIDLIVDFLNK